MECPNCSFNNPDDLKFCGNCGTPLILQCTKCGNENPAHFKFCGQCGAPLIQGPEIPTYARRSPLDYTPPFLVKTVHKARSALVVERKLVSVLFADVVNFVSMSEHLELEEVHQIMDGCFEILGREVHGAGGSINQYTGDGIMALFGAPIAYDDHIKPACHAALQIQRKLRKYGKRIVSRYKAPFQMRIGIHSGKVLVGAIGDNLRLDYTAVGDTTNLAARLQSLAQPEKILVSDAIRRSAESHFRFRDAGLLEIKGKAKPVRGFFLEGRCQPYTQTVSFYPLSRMFLSYLAQSPGKAPILLVCLGRTDPAL